MANDTLSNLLMVKRAKYTVGQAPATPTLECGLFVSNTVPSCTTILSDFTECTAPGYARIPLSESGWTGSTTACVTTYVTDTVTFSFTGPGSPGQTIYGHFIDDSTSGDLFWSRNWGSSFWFALPSGSSIVELTPSWIDQQC